MTAPATPEIECDTQHPILTVTDVLVAADFYTRKLGFTPALTWGDPPTMAGVNLAGVQLFLEHGTPNPTGCSVYFVVGEKLKQKHEIDYDSHASCCFVER